MVNESLELTGALRGSIPTTNYQIPWPTSSPINATAASSPTV
jgi:hypothetical protein